MTVLPKGKWNDSMTKLRKNCRDKELGNEKNKTYNTKVLQNTDSVVKKKGKKPKP